MIPIQEVRDFWDRRPCNLRHSPKAIGTQEYFDEVEARKYFVEPHIPRFAQFGRWQGKRVLEIGCGIGTDTINFARHGAWVTAVDLSEKSLEIARGRAEVYGLQDYIRFYLGNAEELTQFVPMEEYDLVYSFGVLHHTPRPREAVRQVLRYCHANTILKVMLYHRCSWKALTVTKGRLWRGDLIARHSEAQTGCPVTHTFTQRGARELLEGFEVIDMRVDHIFRYRVKDYMEYRYVKPWHLRFLPRWVERVLGWHLCITARKGKECKESPSWAWGGSAAPSLPA